MANLLLADGFEDGTLNAWDRAISIVPFNAGAGAYAGSWVARGDFVDNFNSRLEFNTGNLTKIYVKFRIKYESTWPWGSLNNTKHCRVHDNTNYNGNGLFWTWFNGDAYFDGNRFGDEAATCEGSGDTFQPSLNTWHLMEFYFDVAPGTSNGISWWKFNGAIIGEESNCAFAMSGSFIQQVYFLGNIGFGSVPNSYFQLDAVEIWDDVPTGGPTPPAAPTNLRLLP